ncbi:MAG: dethiobiotin synthase [Planctomycetes bacterium]|nr:dethiobiotin synthase [Planctomycetota bacterium]
MSKDFRSELDDAATRWREAGLERKLTDPAGIDFSSNDYLGLSKHPSVINAAIAAIEEHGAGAPSARLLRGNYPIHRQAELTAAQFVGTENALLLPSGWQANIAIVTTLATQDDVLICDELIHASLIDASRLSKASVKIFKHNDVGALEQCLLQSSAMRQRFIVVEDIYSMDGDRTPLPEIIELCEKYDAYVILDLAHSVGLYPPRHYQSKRVITRMVTGGKALGVGGGIICASDVVINHLLNHARPFVFTTAVPPATCGALQRSMQLLREQPELGELAHRNAQLLRELLRVKGFDCLGESPIVPLIVGSAQATIEASNKLAELGFDVRAIRPPTVAEGSSRLRIVVHAGHSAEQISDLADAIAQCVVVDKNPIVKNEKNNDLLVVGTDTDVGKTVISSLLVRAAVRYGYGVKYLKPIQTGKDSDTNSVQALAELDSSAMLSPFVELALPASVDQAAAAEGAHISMNDVLPKVRQAIAENELTILETAGGLLVPWNDQQHQGDFAQRLGIEAVLVVRTGLGTLNHTLLTIEALAKRHIKLRAVFMVGDPHNENKNSIQAQILDVPIFEFPLFKKLSTANLDLWLDTEDLQFLFKK